VNPAARRHFPRIILLILLLIGGILRCRSIDREGQSPDEFWSVYLSTGRAQTIFSLPPGKLLDPPPPATLRSAPSWPHVWTGMINAIHPPLYHVILRWWMDLFGDSDAVTRAMSGLFSLAGAVVLYDALRRAGEPTAGLIAAAMMIFAVGQIDMSQQTRSYTMLAFCGVVACHAVIRIETCGAYLCTLRELSLAWIAALLTHYLAVPALGGLGLYALIRLRGRDRNRTVAAMLISSLVALALWYPWLRRQYPLFTSDYTWLHEPTPGIHQAMLRVLYIPAAQLYGRPALLATIAPAVIVYLLPLLWIKRKPQMLIWWFWTAGVIFSLTLRDLASHTLLSAFPKYTFAASPAICALASIPSPLPGWRRWILPGAMLFSVVVATVQRWQQGPPPQADWRGLSRQIDQWAAPRDPLIFAPDPFWGSPAFSYIALMHYVPDSQRPILMLARPADASVLRQLSGFNRIWLIRPMAAPQIDWLPGWIVLKSTARPDAAFVLEMVPAISQSSSPPANRSPAP
jgi:hypothetical protein